MHQFMLDMMAMMMPFMMPLVWVGVALIALGVLSVLTRLVSGGLLGNRGAAWAGTLLIVVGLFFIACQGAGMLLGATPAINFGDSTKYEFDLKPFWMVGLAFLIPGLVIRALRGPSRS
jgi:TRAP-type mannitol/chloroaromatic compound transport system permease small subunit